MINEKLSAELHVKMHLKALKFPFRANISCDLELTDEQKEYFKSNGTDTLWNMCGHRNNFLVQSLIDLSDLTEKNFVYFVEEDKYRG